MHIPGYLRDRNEIRKWEMNGKPLPPPHVVKQRVVKEYARIFSVNILIETGTYCGDMVYATKNTFKSIFSIEIDKDLFEGARRRFVKFGHITIVQGDSTQVLPSILPSIRSPCLFWLDGHYSGGITGKGELETPIVQELLHITKHPIKEHVVLIDDARCFVGSGNYPTIQELHDLILSRFPGHVFQIKDDIIRINRRIGK